MNKGTSASGPLREVLESRQNPAGEEVVAASGGWISGPSLGALYTVEDWPDDEYGQNIVRFMDDYPDFVILDDASGWVAHARGKRSRATGPGMHATSLDELAAILNACRRREDAM